MNCHAIVILAWKFNIMGWELLCHFLWSSQIRLYTANCKKTVGHIFKSHLEHTLIHICKIFGSAAKLQVLFIGIVFTPLEYEGFETLNHAIIPTKGAPASEKKTRGRFFFKATFGWTN